VTLAAEIQNLIAARGPIPVADYMALALGHPKFGYYATRDPLGATGDFTTAPEISQMFGELIGAWVGAVWSTQGGPAEIVLAEFGPGRGTLMVDALRALRKAGEFLEAAEIWLIETSPVLRAAQAERLSEFNVRWAQGVEELPDVPTYAVANEFFDVLPIRQFRRAGSGWQERLVDVSRGRFVFIDGPVRLAPHLDMRFPLLPDGVVVEVNPAAEKILAVLGRRIAARGGAGLIVDYGAWDGVGDTLQAIRAHCKVDPLDAPGGSDITAHVRFRALAEAARPAQAFGPLTQGVFLDRLGIGARAARLAQGRTPATQETIAGQLRRLTAPEEMGTLFKAMALLPPGQTAPPGYEADAD
jgi:NADH dehydrogenase [ubiquinone] 1 alpha subcomplex assembly factor 7